MASVLQVLPAPTSTTLSPTRSRWPAERRQRWALRLALAAPLIVSAWWVDRQGFVSLANARFLAAAERLAAGGSDLSGLGAAYPPVPVLLALLPGGALTLSIAASIVAAGVLQRTWGLLARRGLSAPLLLCLLLPVVAAPAVAFVASQSVAAIGSLALVGIALEGLAWFTIARQTEAGFVTGLALAGAFLLDPVALFFAVTVALMALLVARERFRDEPGAALASVAVMTFPVAFLAACWAFLQWRFTGSATDWFLVKPETLQFAGGVWAGLGGATVDVLLTVATAPLFVVVAALFWREPLTMLGQLVAVPVCIVALWWDLPVAPVSIYVLVTLVALTHVPRGLGRTARVLLGCVGLVQVSLAWVVAPTGPGFEIWSQLLLGAV